MEASPAQRTRAPNPRTISIATAARDMNTSRNTVYSMIGDGLLSSFEGKPVAAAVEALSAYTLTAEQITAELDIHANTLRQDYADQGRQIGRQWRWKPEFLDWLLEHDWPTSSLICDCANGCERTLNRKLQDAGFSRIRRGNPNQWYYRFADQEEIVRYADTFGKKLGAGDLADIAGFDPEHIFWLMHDPGYRGLPKYHRIDFGRREAHGSLPRWAAHEAEPWAQRLGGDPEAVLGPTVADRFFDVPAYLKGKPLPVPGLRWTLGYVYRELAMEERFRFDRTRRAYGC